MPFRPFVTFAGHAAQMPTIVAVDVNTPRDGQRVLQRVSGIVKEQLGTLAATITPETQRQFAAKVEFFRVALG